MSMLDAIDSPIDLKRLPAASLPALAWELREEIIATCAQNGGHLGASLGAVDLVLALHYVFTSPLDRLVFDVGHQAYAHKLLTGRRDRFRTIRKEGGLSGFPSRTESEHDAFGAGHASTSVSAALGMVEARRQKGENGRVVAVIGDGGLTGGMAFEALNHAGHLERDLIVVLNHNEQSISPNVGALSRWFSKRMTGATFNTWRRGVKEALRGLPKGPKAIAAIRRALSSTKALFTPGILFEGLGFQYVGPIDGHNLADLVETLERVKGIDGPVLVHVVTEKGKGYGPAEADEVTRGHGMGPFDIATGKSTAKRPPVKTYQEFFADDVVELMRGDPRVVAITAAMLEGTSLNRVQQVFPDRVYDVGIAEQHAVTFAAGLACEGLRPIAAIYSTFLQRAYDQIVHDVCLQKLPVTFALDRAGIVGADGATHQGAYDLAYLRVVPNLTIMAPADENELRHMLYTALSVEGPAAVRFPRGSGLGIPLDSHFETLPLGKGRVVFGAKGKPDLLIAALGSMVHPAMEAAERLAAKGLHALVVDARFVKPLDEPLFADLAAQAGRVLTVEEAALAGGFGSAVREALDRAGVRLSAFQSLGMPDVFLEHGDPARQRASIGLDAAGIAKAALALCGGARTGAASAS
ncbi:MAG: 1-deoxy-D-xylulose-5-phosphate synthase [Deltaproteobacteria bacterium]